MRRIVSAKIKFISLVPKGANQLPVIYKADDAVEISSMVKAADDFDERGELLSVVYAPEMVDSQGDIASQETIKEMMYGAAKDGFNVDIRHNNEALSKDDAFVAESFLIQKGDTRFADFKNYKGESVDVTGGWATVIKINNEALRKAYRNGEWNGVSMAGTAEFVQEKQDLDGFVEKLATLLKTPEDGDIDMKPEELAKILADNNAALLEGIAKAVKPEAPEEKPADQGVAKADADDCLVKKPVLKSATDPKAVAEYQKELTAYNLAKDVDWEDAEAVAAYHKAITEKEEVISDADANIDKSDSDEVKKLKKQLAKAQRQSNAGVSKEDSPSGNSGPSIGGISKEDQELMLAGRTIGQAHAKAMGY